MTVGAYPGEVVNDPEPERETLEESRPPSVSEHPGKLLLRLAERTFPDLGHAELREPHKDPQP